MKEGYKYSIRCSQSTHEKSYYNGIVHSYLMDSWWSLDMFIKSRLYCSRRTLIIRLIELGLLFNEGTIFFHCCNEIKSLIGFLNWALFVPCKTKKC